MRSAGLLPRFQISTGCRRELARGLLAIRAHSQPARSEPSGSLRCAVERSRCHSTLVPLPGVSDELSASIRSRLPCSCSGEEGHGIVRHALSLERQRRTIARSNSEIPCSRNLRMRGTSLPIHLIDGAIQIEIPTTRGQSMYTSLQSPMTVRRCVADSMH